MESFALYYTNSRLYLYVFLYSFHIEFSVFGSWLSIFFRSFQFNALNNFDANVIFTFFLLNSRTFNRHIFHQTTKFNCKNLFFGCVHSFCFDRQCGKSRGDEIYFFFYFIQLVLSMAVVYSRILYSYSRVSTKQNLKKKNKKKFSLWIKHTSLKRSLLSLKSNRFFLFLFVTLLVVVFFLFLFSFQIPRKERKNNTPITFNIYIKLIKRNKFLYTK